MTTEIQPGMATSVEVPASCMLDPPVAAHLPIL